MQNIFLNLYILFKEWIFFTLSTCSPHDIPKRPSLSLASSPQPCLAMVAEAALDVPLYSSAALLLHWGQQDGHQTTGSPWWSVISSSILLIRAIIAL